MEEKEDRKFKLLMAFWASVLIGWVLLALSMQALHINQLSRERSYLRERLFSEMSLRQQREEVIERQTLLHSAYEGEIAALRLQTEMLRVDRYIAGVNREINSETRWRIILAIYSCAPIADVDPLLALAVMEQESRFRVFAKSTKDARGLMQLLPSTALAELGIPTHKIYDVNLNVCGGISYLSRHLRRYEGVQTAALQRYYGGGTEEEYPRPVLNRYQRILKEVRR